MPKRLSAVTRAGCAMVLSSFLLVSCTTLVGQAPQPAQMAADPRICTSTEPKPDIPDGAGIVRPPKSSPYYMPAFLYFSWVEDVLAWGERGWARAELAQRDC